MSRYTQHPKELYWVTGADNHKEAFYALIQIQKDWAGVEDFRVVANGFAFKQIEVNCTPNKSANSTQASTQSRSS